MKIGVLLSRVRVEEKWILEALENRDITFNVIDDRQTIFDVDQKDEWLGIFRLSLERSLILFPRSYMPPSS